MNLAIYITIEYIPVAGFDIKCAGVDLVGTPWNIEQAEAELPDDVVGRYMHEEKTGICEFVFEVIFVQEFKHAVEVNVIVKVAATGCEFTKEFLNLEFVTCEFNNDLSFYYVHFLGEVAGVIG